MNSQNPFPHACPGHRAHRLPSLAGFLTLAALASNSSAATLPVSFHLSTAPTAVAMQFDVGLNVSGATLGTPVLQGASPHQIDSQMLSNGKTRFVIYSSTNTSIAPTGSIAVDLDLGLNAAQNGMLSVSGVMASSETGSSVFASPGAKPVVVNVSPPSLTKAVTGIQIPVGVEVVDPDGTITMLIYRLNGSPVGSASSPPFTTSLTSTTAGDFSFTAFFQDSAGNAGSSAPVTLRFVDPSSLTSFSAFQSAWLDGSGSFDADSFGTGIPNGLAWALGMDPRNPDRSRLPTHLVENDAGNQFLVYRARVLASGLVPQILASDSMATNDWSAVPAGQLTEELESGGWKLIEARLPITPAAPRQFVKLGVQQQ